MREARAARGQVRRNRPHRLAQHVDADGLFGDEAGLLRQRPTLLTTLERDKAARLVDGDDLSGGGSARREVHFAARAQLGLLLRVTEAEGEALLLRPEPILAVALAAGETLLILLEFLKPAFLAVEVGPPCGLLFPPVKPHEVGHELARLGSRQPRFARHPSLELGLLTLAQLSVLARLIHVRRSSVGPRSAPDRDTGGLREAEQPVAQKQRREAIVPVVVVDRPRALVSPVVRQRS